MSVLEKLIDIISVQLGINKESLSANSLLEEDLKADSLDMVEMVMSVESFYDIEIDDVAVKDFKTIGDVADYVASIIK